MRFFTIIIIFISFFQFNHYAQETIKNDSVKTEKNATVKDKKFIKDIWSNMKKLDKKYSEYKTVKPESVAGVRGKAKDETLSDMMYYKGNEGVPQDKQVLAAINRLSELAENKDVPSENKPEILFFLGRCYLQVKNESQAKTTFEKITSNYPESEYAEKSQSYLDSMGE